MVDSELGTFMGPALSFISKVSPYFVSLYDTNSRRVHFGNPSGRDTGARLIVLFQRRMGYEKMDYLGRNVGRGEV